jgi:hypothetical protein
LREVASFPVATATALARNTDPKSQLVGADGGTEVLAALCGQAEGQVERLMTWNSGGLLRGIALCLPEIHALAVKSCDKPTS